MFKKSIIFLLLIALFFLTIGIYNLVFEEDNIISKQENYIVFYNGVTATNIENIIKYDMAILEPLNIDSDQLLILNKWIGYT